MHPPTPNLEGLTAEYYGFCARGELRLQRCTDCGRWRHPPRVLCAACRSPRFEWGLTGGRGSLHTWTVIHRPVHPAFADQVPYVLAVVELDEGPRLVSRLSQAELDELRIGLPLVVTFVRENDVTFPWFSREITEGVS